MKRILWTCDFSSHLVMQAGGGFVGETADEQKGCVGKYVRVQGIFEVPKDTPAHEINAMVQERIARLITSRWEDYEKSDDYRMLDPDNPPMHYIRA